MSSLLRSTQNTRSLLPDSLRYVRSDVPAHLSGEEIRWLLEQDIRWIIDLRQEEERREKPCPLAASPGFFYHCLPVSGGNAVPASPEQVPLSYLAMVDEQMQRILDSILSSPHNVLYFCNAGKDRTGVVSALLLQKLGFGTEAIVADYMRSGENLRESLQAYAAAHPQADLRVITPCPDYMTDFLRLLQQRQSLPAPENTKKS